MAGKRPEGSFPTSRRAWDTVERRPDTAPSPSRRICIGCPLEHAVHNNRNYQTAQRIGSLSVMKSVPPSSERSSCTAPSSRTTKRSAAAVSHSAKDCTTSAVALLSPRMTSSGSNGLMPWASKLPPRIRNTSSTTWRRRVTSRTGTSTRRVGVRRSPWPVEVDRPARAVPVPGRQQIKSLPAPFPVPTQGVHRRDPRIEGRANATRVRWAPRRLMPVNRHRSSAAGPRASTRARALSQGARRRRREGLRTPARARPLGALPHDPVAALQLTEFGGHGHDSLGVRSRQ